MLDIRSIGICGLALGLFFVLPSLPLSPDIRVYLRFSAVLTAAIAIGLLIHDKNGETSTCLAKRRACPIARRTPGPGSSSYTAGDVVYSSPIEVDDKKETGEPLHTNEMQLRQLIDALPALVWRATAEGEPCYFNGASLFRDR